MDKTVLPNKILIIQRIYFVLIILFATVTLLNIFVQYNPRKMLEGFLFVFLFGTIYFGLRYMKDWVIHLVLITSAFSCFWLVINILIPSGDITAFVFKILAGLLLFFFGYQIPFFRKPEIRRIFGVKGKAIF